MSAIEAIAKLRSMQSQIIHGSNIFGEIADCLEHCEKERAAWEAVAAARLKELENIFKTEYGKPLN